MEKRTIGSYEVLNSIYVGEKEVVVCVDDNAENRYVCGYYEENDLFGICTDTIESNDYLEIMSIFCDRAKEQVEKAKEKVIPNMGVITSKMCITDSYSESIEGKVVAIKPDVLRREYQSAEHQLYYVTGGFGAAANARGRTVYGINVYNGESTRWTRDCVMGEVKAEHTPDWAKDFKPPRKRDDYER